MSASPSTSPKPKLVKKSNLPRLNIDRVPRLRLMIAADPGVGKTQLAASALAVPEMREAAWCDIDGGLMTVRDLLLTGRYDRKHAPLQRVISTSQDLESFFWEYRRGEHPDIHTVVIDNASELVPLENETIVTRKTQKEMSQGKQRHESIDDWWIDDQGETNRRLARIIRWWRNLDVNLIVTAHVREISKGQGDQRRVVGYRPHFPPGLVRSLMGYFDGVWMMRTDTDGTRWMLTQPRAGIEVKTRGTRFAQQLGGVFRVPEDRPFLADIYTLLRDPDAKLPVEYQQPARDVQEKEKKA